MTAADHYESWKQRRADANVPEGFADRVLAALERLPRPGYPPSRWRRFLVFWFSPRVSKVGLCALAGLALAYRMLSVVALFFPQ